MAKPRIFVSSTYYDLKHVRNSLSTFIEEMGYESVLFENGDIPFSHDTPLDESCYSEVKSCHMLVLIVGGRYGAPASSEGDTASKKNGEYFEFYNSITKKEYETAVEQDIPIYVFVEKGVLSEYQTFKKNRTNSKIEYAHVDHPNIFILLDAILSKPRNNLTRDFEKVDEIIEWLKSQWAGLFADFIAKRKDAKILKDLSSNILDLKTLASTLKEYTETIGRKVDSEHFATLIENRRKKVSEETIQRFANEPLIEFLSDKFKTTAAIIFEKIATASSLEELLKSIGAKNQEIKNFLLQHEMPARRDFEELKSKYINML